jgi:hypothetical protein
MTHLVAIVVVLGLSGLPAGSLLCGLSCAPEETTAPSCHLHGGSDDGVPAMDGVHLCDQDAAAEPMIASPAFSIAAADFVTAHIQPHLLLPQRVVIAAAWEFPPGSPSARLVASPSVLRI